jgi:hypothetical protein
MKMTLLEMVQDILNDTDSDEVNSVNDTTESIQVAQVIKTTFYEMISRRNWPHLRKFFTVENSTDTDRPTHVLIPEAVQEVLQDTLHYDKQKVGDTKTRYETVKWLAPDDFLRMTNTRDSSATRVTEVTDFDGAKFLILNDVAPEYYTSFDDDYIVFDAYDSVVESTIQSSKTQVMGFLIPSWTLDDAFKPDFPAEAFPTFLAEAKSTASLIIKQQADVKAEVKAQRGDRRLSRKAWRTHEGVLRPNYGRRSSKGMHRNPPFNKD